MRDESCSWRSELNVDAERIRARTRIRDVIETARGDAATRIAIRRVHLGIEALIAREEQEIVARDVHARRLTAHDSSGHAEGVADRKILQARERAVLDPPRRELRRLADAVRSEERRVGKESGAW